MPETSKQLDKSLQKVSVNDNLEPFTFLPILAKQRGLSTVICETLPYLRKKVASQLMDAAADFEKQGYVLRVESAYRSLDHQSRRFSKRYQDFKREYPDKNHTDLLDLAATYTAGMPLLAAHAAGAAVDVTLLLKGQPLDFGVPYGHGGQKASTAYQGINQAAKSNRQLLKRTMVKHGFINYPFEYWHYSIGDVYAAHATGQEAAVYGPVDYDESQKQIKPTDPKQINQYFEVENI